MTVTELEVELDEGFQFVKAHGPRSFPAKFQCDAAQCRTEFTALVSWPDHINGELAACPACGQVVSARDVLLIRLNRQRGRA